MTKGEAKVVKIHKNSTYNDLIKELSIDCEKCCGLCCVALYFAKTEGFPADKEAGKPCQNLMQDFKCVIHSKLSETKMKGCLAFDCFGAGQKVTQDIYQGEDWRLKPQMSEQMFQVFIKVWQLHQMLWYLIEAYSITEEELRIKIDALIKENQQITQLSPDEILYFDMEEYRTRVNESLKEAGDIVYQKLNGSAKKELKIDFMGKNFRGANLSGKDFSMTFFIAANMEGCNLYGTNFLGADMRDANIKSTDLSQSIFLTQAQINSARGNSNTKLPTTLIRPKNW